MTCPVCKGSGMIMVNVHGPNETPQGEARPCFCGIKPTPKAPQLAVDNMRVKPFRVKLGAVKPKPIQAHGEDADYNGPDEPVDPVERWK